MIHLPKLPKLLRILFALTLFSFMPRASYAQAPSGPKHSATASWTAAAGATGYNLYRCLGTCSTASGTFTIVNPAPISTVTYTDTAVVNGTTYSWCATSLVTLSTGPFESACSNIATATIPKDPTSPPAGFGISGVQ